MTFKKLVGQLHLWLGLITGLVIFIVAITGCIYVFSYEISSIVYKDKREVKIPTGASRLNISQMKNTANTVIPEGIELSRILIPADSNSTVAFVFDKINREAWTYTSYIEFYKTVYINPYNGEIVEVENTKWEFFNVVFWTHMSLLTGYKLGGQIITWCIYIFVIIVFSGLILWWPKKKFLKQYFWFRWKKKTKWKRKNYDLHRVLGLYVIPFALLFSFTGLFWASESFNDFARWVANGGEEPVEKPFPTIDTTATVAGEPIDLVFNKVQLLAPNAKYILMRIIPRPTAPYIVRAYMGDFNYNRQEYFFDPFSTDLLNQVSFETRNNGDKLSALNYDLHVGAIGGLATKVLAFCCSLIIASLPVTGFYIWWLKRK